MNVTAEALDVKAYKFPKVHGTRCLAHQRRGVDVLLHNWIILQQAIENTLASAKKPEAKLQGYLKKLKNFTFLGHCFLYKDILDIVAALSLNFEKEKLMVFEIGPAVERTLSELDDLLHTYSTQSWT